MVVLGRRGVDSDGRPDQEGRGQTRFKRESGAKARCKWNEEPVRRASGAGEARGIEAQRRKGEFLIFEQKFSSTVARSYR